METVVREQANALNISMATIAEKDKNIAELKVENEKFKSEIIEKDKAISQLQAGPDEANKIILKQNAIIEKLNANSMQHINKSDLAEILGRSPGSRETIGNLKLRKVIMFPGKYGLD